MPVSDQELADMSLNALAGKNPGVAQLLKEYSAQKTTVNEDEEKDEGKARKSKNYSRLEAEHNALKERFAQIEATEKNSLIADLAQLTGNKADAYANVDLATVRLIHNTAMRTAENTINEVQQGAKATPSLTQPDPHSSSPPTQGEETEEKGYEDEEEKRKRTQPAEPTNSPDYRGNAGNARTLRSRIRAPSTRNAREPEPMLSVYEAIGMNHQDHMDKERGQ